MKHYDFVFVVPFSVVTNYPPGGLNISYVLSSYLKKDGYNVGILHVTGASSPGNLVNLVGNFIIKNKGMFKLFHKLRQHRYDYGVLDGVDLLSESKINGYSISRIFATAWQTARFVSDYAAENRNSEAFYIVQNFENNQAFSSTYSKEAAETYKLKNLKKIVNCKGLQDGFKSESPPIIPMGIDGIYKPYTNPKTREQVLMTTLKKNVSKGGVYALEAIRRIKKEMPECRIIAYGDVPKEEIPSYIEYYTPYTRTLEELFNKSAVFIHSSLIEGFGSPPLEAMACGCVPVISDSIGVREYARDGKNCFLVPIKDSNALATAAIRLLRDKQMRLRFVSEGIKTGKRFTYKIMYKSFISLFDENKKSRTSKS